MLLFVTYDSTVILQDTPTGEPLSQDAIKNEFLHRIPLGLVVLAVLPWLPGIKTCKYYLSQNYYLYGTLPEFTPVSLSSSIST